nr:PREDICTED: zinc finger protein 2 homolog [Anolis carolinensis]|eukprot:XP_008120498.1 PREDICTED: zinc finger protein 2 homolog [Anolis carolinensis]
MQRRQESGREIQLGNVSSSMAIYEQKMDEVALDLTCPSRKIQHENEENKDAAVSLSPTDKAGVAPDNNEMAIQTTVLAKRKWEPSNVFAKSWERFKTFRRTEHQQEVQPVDEANGPVLCGGNGNIPSEAGVPAVGNVLETGSEKGLRGLWSKSMVSEETKETSWNQDGSRKRERDWTKDMPFKKKFTQYDDRRMCSERGKSSNYSPGFVTHQTSHSEIGYYKCAECRKPFHSLLSLTEHERTHLMDSPSTSRVRHYFKPWMLDSLQEVCHRQPASNEPDDNPKQTELPQSLLRSPSPYSLVPAAQTDPPVSRPPHPGTLFLNHPNTSPFNLYIRSTHAETGSFSQGVPVIQISPPSSVGQWTMEQQLPDALVLAAPEDISTQVFPGQEVASVHSPSPTLGMEFPQRINIGVEGYPCLQCEENFDNPAKLKLHQNECKKLKPFQCPHCNKGFYDELSFSEHKKLHATESP